MAAPITHVVLTIKVFDRLFHGKDLQKFIVGTTLPDIRYLGSIDRDKTHFKKVTLKEIQDLGSFEAGLKFHSLVDEVRESYMVNNDYYSFFPESAVVTQAQKMLEDRILYDKIADWKAVTRYFENICEEEIKLIGRADYVKKWHELLIRYFSARPGDQENIALTVDMGFPEERGDEINKIAKTCNHEGAKVIINSFYDNFEELILAF